MEKTAMQELIYFMENQEYNFFNKEQLTSCLKISKKATELLKKEKEQIEEAYYKGYDKWESADIYYNQTFNKI